MILISLLIGRFLKSPHVRSEVIWYHASDWFIICDFFPVTEPIIVGLFWCMYLAHYILPN